MKYHNGQLRNEQDATLCLRPATQKHNVNWKECIPFVVLGTLMLGVLIEELL